MKFVRITDIIKLIVDFKKKGGDNVNPYLEPFRELLENEDKQAAVAFSIDLLKSNKIDIVTLYSEVLTPALNQMTCLLADKKLCIWKEHVRTAIVRTIVECCYPYVLDQKKKEGLPFAGTAAVICPPGEYHDLGARMVTDFLALCGCDCVFVGSDTPYEDFYNAIDAIAPKFIAISVSNYFNLVATKKIIADLKKLVSPDSKIIVGGYAFGKDKNKAEMIGADHYAATFLELRRIVKGGESL